MKKIQAVLFIILFAIAPFSMAKAQTFGIAATVNKDAISESDLDDRTKLILISSGLQNTKENRRKARPQALNSLIEEQLKIQEAQKQNLPVLPEEIDRGFEAIAAQNKFTSEQFSKLLEQQGIPKATLLNQIKAQIAWTKVVTKVLRPKVDVSENDINAKMERIKNNIGKIEYQAAEIFLPVNDQSEENQTKELALKLIEEIKAGKAPFALVAQQFSKSASAEQGGSLGWVQEGELPKEQDVVLKSLSKGQISPPIRGLSGFHILTLNEKRSVSGDTLPSEEEVLNSIGLERLDRLQQRYLSDIRSAAFIDRRN
ncbi:MAG TPA: peptidylprolyl isomerase [Alphaproteobacteria bacterium]|nr:peptidylprolyl isomerase [Alphaproteobacteria bacterium]